MLNLEHTVYLLPLSIIPRILNIIRLVPDKSTLSSPSLATHTHNVAFHFNLFFHINIHMHEFGEIYITYKNFGGVKVVGKEVFKKNSV